MEVLVPEHPGVPADCIVSIRCGGTRRQAPLEVARSQALKFPSQPDLLTEPLKIDVLQPVASSRLVLHPTQESYLMDFWDQPNMALGLTISSSSSSSASPAEGQAAEAARSTSGPVSARDYLELHGVLKYVQSMLTALIQSRPQDPYLFMMHQLKSVRAYGLPSAPRPAAASPPGTAKPAGEEEREAPARPAREGLPSDTTDSVVSSPKSHESRPLRARQLLQMQSAPPSSAPSEPRDPEESRRRLQRVLLLASRNGAWEGALQTVFKTATCTCLEGCCSKHSMEPPVAPLAAASPASPSPPGGPAGPALHELRQRVRSCIADAWHSGELKVALKEALEESRASRGALIPGQASESLAEAQKVIKTMQVELDTLAQQREELHEEVQRLKRQLQEVLEENQRLAEKVAH